MGIQIVPSKARCIVGTLAMLALFVGLSAQPTRGQSIRPAFSDRLTLTEIGAPFFGGGNQSRITQMTLHPGPAPTQEYLYFSSNVNGIGRVTYDWSQGSFVSGSLTQIAPNIKGLGIAIHGDSLYASEPYESSANSANKLSRIWRIEEMGLGQATAIVEGIPRDDHGVNHIQIVGDSLYVGIGVRTRNGAFQTFSGDNHGESAYGGTLGVIDNLNNVPSTPNAAGFYPANPDLTTYRQLIRGEHPDSALPLTTTADNKLRIHSTGTRNPFGVAIDGDENPWISVNWQRTENHVYDRDNLNDAEGDAWGGDGFQDDIHDQFFQTQPKADYGYRNSNWQNSDVAQSAGFFLPENRMSSFTFDNYDDPAVATDLDDQNPAYNQNYNSNSSPGLGPSSSANGFDFYQSNEFPIEFHKDAFVARWNGTINDGGDSVTYRDVVSVDSDTGDVRRIASGFRRPLDVIADGHGAILVSDHEDSIFLIHATNPTTDAHGFSWDTNADGVWSDRLQWNADSLAEADRLVPHEWGDAKYAVRIDRDGASPTVTLDQDARIESLQLADELKIESGRTLQVAGSVEVESEGILVGSGQILGRVHNGGTVSPGIGVGTLSVQSFEQTDAGTLMVQIDGGGNADLLDIGFETRLSGTLGTQLDAELTDGMPRGEARQFRIIDTGPDATPIVGGFQRLEVNGQLGRHSGDGVFSDVIIEPTTVALQILKAQPGDGNGDGLFNSKDFIDVFLVGEYEDPIDDNSDWTEGDWNGDMDFTSSDMIVAFLFGGYSEQAVANVPEPSTAWMLILGAGIGFARRRGAIASTA